LGSWVPNPTSPVVTYRYLPKKGDANVFNRLLLEAVLASGRAAISATDITAPGGGSACGAAAAPRFGLFVAAVLSGVLGIEINGRYTLRLAVMHYRTHLEHVDEVLELLTSEAARLEAS
jgi:aromatic-L-amino-acid/L-tryptophan decarboxylase